MWRILSSLPLFGALAQGRIWRWFAVNIPMDLGTGGAFNSDIDLIAQLDYFPLVTGVKFFRTWEVKAAAIAPDGTARSLKAGKLHRLINQLLIYREFGAPDVSLLDVFLCEPGFFQSHDFPTPQVLTTLSAKLPELKEYGLGYYALAFQHEAGGRDQLGLVTWSFGQRPGNTVWNPLAPQGGQPSDGFAQLARRLSQFFETTPERPAKHFHQIVFCRACRQLQLIRMRDEHLCPACGGDLIQQF